MNIDVVVVGAGPAGCAAAARLTHDGASVLLVHRAAVNLRRSESLPGAAARVLAAAGLTPLDGLTAGRCGGTLSAWGNSHLAASDALGSPDGAGWFIDRQEFDEALRQRCTAIGVALSTDRVIALRRNQTRWLARFAHGADVAARWVIDATGRASAVARRVGAKRRNDAPLVAVHAVRELEAHHLLPARIFVESEPDGWWYVGASAQRRIGAACVLRPADAQSLRGREEFAARLGGRQHLQGWAGEPKAWSTPQVSPAGGAWLDRVCGEGWIACGDAAVAFDPLSSQGLLGALAGGVVAAQAICAHNTGNALADVTARHREVRAIYEARRSAAYAREQRWASRPFWLSQHGADETTRSA
ncbi:flavin-dependent dehydrogenase [Mycobacterium sp. OAS707]|uniref:lycopene cyclase family protein n=1 Tax=Mycobacterium sp. OAS707 TaxID=2663822 RepID=UPI00178B5EA2|nr:lycopene cyclase family protein [Mycobacterium sp. OAS707]MBE1551831.1 flavin-dependent dehydrogenase [Mycobacterium sp. OAS707]